MRLARVLFISLGLLFEMMHFSSAQTWNIVNAPSNDWTSIASSSDGNRLVAVAAANGIGGIYVSSDSGLTWEATSAPLFGDYVSVASSASGGTLVAVGYSNLPVISKDSGATWQSTSVGIGYYWNSVASSQDGSKIVASTTGNGFGNPILTLIGPSLFWGDSGVPYSTWYSVTSSGSGNTLLAVGDDGAYLSTDSGVTWNQPTIPSDLIQGSATCSADGTKLAVAVTGFFDHTTDGIYVSTDSGMTWTGPNFIPGNIVASADGSTLINACGDVYISHDWGTTWASTSAPSGVSLVACSSEGSKLAASDGVSIFKLDLSTCNLNVHASYYQGDGDNSVNGVPKYFGFYSSQTNDGSSDPLTGRARTRRWGCALCSLATMLTSFSGLESTTPAQLDSALVTLDTVGGSTITNYFDRANINWAAINRATGNRVKLADVNDKVNDVTIGNYLAEHFCGLGQRIILHFNEYKNGVSAGGHFVLVTGKNTNGWILFDPGLHNASPPDRLSTLIGHQAGFYPVMGGVTNFAEYRTYHVDKAIAYEVNVSQAAALYGVAMCPVELLITDPLGRRLGWDMNTLTELNEIPGASYFRDFPIADDDEGSSAVEGDTTGTKGFYVSSPLPGTYQVTAVGMAPGAFAVKVNSEWPSSGGQSFTFSGVASVNSSFTNNINVVLPPQINVQPLSQTVAQGSNVIFTVSASGNQPLMYQWSFNNSNLTNGSQISGSQSNVLTIAQMVESRAGSYQVIVTNAYGAATSSLAVLDLGMAPQITMQPTNALIESGGVASLSVGVIGTSPFTFQWNNDATQLSDGGRVSGATTSNLILSNIIAADSGSYTVTVSNMFGSIVSTGAVLTVSIPTLYSLMDFVDGSAPNGLVLGKDGYLYGTAQRGGPYEVQDPNGLGYGTLYRVALDGTLTMLHAFDGGLEGRLPTSELTVGGNGNIYGTTYSGGASTNQPSAGNGTVFLASTDGELTVLNYFNDFTNGANPRGLAEGLDGNFYGTTQNGGAYNLGVVFKLTPSGIVSNLHSFTGNNEGANPYSGLVRAHDGNFFGTTYNGGSNDWGTIYEISTSGSFHTIYQLGDNDGSFPLAGMAEAIDGSFYGTTSEGGIYDFGTVFKITTNGIFTNLYSFTGGSDSGFPVAQLIRSSDGAFYGTTEGFSSGTGNDYGTVFKVSTEGELTTLYHFSGGIDGAGPAGRLAIGADGNLYGTTIGGGEHGSVIGGIVYGYGTIFRINIAPQIPFIHDIIGAGGLIQFDWNAIEGKTYQVQFKTSLIQNNWTNLGGVITATNTTLRFSSPIALDAGRFYRVVAVP